MLSVLEAKNMYESWESMVHNNIDGYETPEVSFSIIEHVFAI